MPERADGRGRYPAVVWRRVLAIVSGRALLGDDNRRRGKPRLPTRQDVSLAFGTAIKMAREKKWIDAKGKLTAAGRAEEKARLAEPGAEAKRAAYESILLVMRIHTVATKIESAMSDLGRGTEKVVRALERRAVRTGSKGRSGSLPKAA